MADTSGDPEEALATQDGPAEAVLHRWWWIDPDQYQADGRSFVAVLMERMCSKSRAEWGEVREARVPVEEAGGGVRFETRASRVGDHPEAEIASCCSRTPEYRDPQLPLKEMLFRVLLAGGNRPRSLEDLHEEVLAWTGIGDGRVITERVIHRLMERDAYYSFAPTEEPEGAG